MDNNVTQSVNLRSYEHLFVDNNQTTPEDFPIFGYTANTELVSLAPDKDTVFHFPLDAEEVALSASTLVRDGAVPGSIPFRSDLIFKKEANYRNDCFWGDTSPEFRQRGTWLCSWLSGSVMSGDTTPIWYDRWYDPTKMVSADGLKTSDSPYIYDVPSQMTFQPGVLYKYWHFGNARNEQVVKLVNADNTLKLHLEDWVTSSISDSSRNDDHDNGGTYFGVGPASFGTDGVNLYQHPNDYAATFDGVSQSVQVPYASTYIPVSGDFTSVFWAKTKDWATATSNGFVDDGFRGGWKVGVVNGAVTPFFVAIDSTLNAVDPDNNGNICWFNEYGKLITTKAMPASSDIVDVAVDNDMYIWMLDDSSDTLKQVDYNGNMCADIVLPSSVSGYSNLWVMQDENILARNSNGSLAIVDHVSMSAVSGTCTSSGPGYIECGGQIYVTDSALGWVDVAGNWHAAAEVTTETVVDIMCDYQDRVWVLSSQSLSVWRWDVISWVLDVIIELDTTAATGISMMCVHENGAVSDFAYVSCKDDFKILKYNMYGEYVDTINTSPYYVAPSLKHGTAYDWWRRFGIRNSIYARVCVGNNSTNEFTASQERYLLTAPISAVANDEWHQLALVRSGNTLGLYLNCVKVDEQSIDGMWTSIVYPYRTMLCIGATCGRTRDLGGEYNLKNTYFAGAIDDVRIYSKALTADMLFYLYFSKFDYQAIDWNIISDPRFYLESVTKFFKFKLPGSKSAHYNIRLSGLHISDVATREIIESIIWRTLSKLTPVYTENLAIIWED